jgi:hypothetical protein
MKNALRCLGLVGILGFSLWLSAPTAAQAATACEDLQRKPCRPFNSTIACTWTSDGSQSTCYCMLQGWICLGPAS